MWHTPESALAQIERLNKLRSEYGTSGKPFQIVVGATISKRDELERFRDVGVTGLIVRPFESSRKAVEGVRRFADRYLVDPVV